MSKQPKVEVSNSKNKKIGAAIRFPEGLEDTPFNLNFIDGLGAVEIVSFVEKFCYKKVLKSK